MEGLKMVDRDCFDFEGRNDEMGVNVPVMCMVCLSV
jgi:hypothetical protein